VHGCARYRAHRNLRSFSDLDARHAGLLDDQYWGRAMRQAVRYEHLESARSHRDFFEVSGWAIAERARFSEAAFTVALATYALGRFLGGGRGIATATTRNHSSRILRRLGGQPLSCEGSPLPPYFDPRFGCVMEVLAFDAARPDPKYSPYVRDFVERIAATPVLFAGEESDARAVDLAVAKAPCELAA
jgi:hypothetical protein